jgi:recombinational DNA repair protein RecT
MQQQTQVDEGQVELRPILMIDPDYTGCSLPSVTSFNTLFKNNKAKLAEMGQFGIMQAEMISADIINAIKRSDNQDLHNCTPESIWNVAYDMVATKLPLDGRGLAYLTCYNVMKKEWDNNLRKNVSVKTGKIRAVLTPSYKGYIYTLRNEFPDLIERTIIIYEGDEFIMSEQDGVATYSYKPKDPFRSDIHNCLGVATYIGYTNTGGRYKSWITVITKEELDVIRKCAKTDGVWAKFFGEQAKKTCIRRALKVDMATIPKRIALTLGAIENADNRAFDMELDNAQTTAAEVQAEVRTSMRDHLDQEKQRVQTAANSPVQQPDTQGMVIDNDVANEPVAEVDERQKLLDEYYNFIDALTEIEDMEERKKLVESNDTFMADLVKFHLIDEVTAIHAISNKIEPGNHNEKEE